MKAGLGFDAHAFGDGVALMLGGVEIHGERGLAGHSDGDALIHAVIDAVLGAAGLGDIGEAFPSDDPSLKGVSSVDLLRRCCATIAAAGWRVENVDAVLIAEAPRIAPYRDAMRTALAEAIGVDPAAVSVKGTTTDGMGFTGRGEGIAAMAVALLAPAG